MKHKLIDNGMITKKEFIRQQSKHKKTLKNLKDNNLNKCILELVKQGKTTREISTKLNFSENYISIRIQQIFRQKKLSKEKIRILKYGKILELLRNGITPQEISNLLGINRKTVYNRQKEFIIDGTLTKEQLKEYREKRTQDFAETRRKAIIECEEDSKKYTNRKKFLKLAQDEINYGNTLDKEDIIFLGKCIIYNDIFLTKENLKLVITQYVVKCDIQELNHFFKYLIMLYGDTEYSDIIEDLRKYATDKIKERESKPIDIVGER